MRSSSVPLRRADTTASRMQPLAPQIDMIAVVEDAIDGDGVEQILVAMVERAATIVLQRDHLRSHRRKPRTGITL
jgi:hypothetical protein